MSNYIKEKINSGILMVITLLLISSFFFTLQEGIKKHEINECNNWAKMAEKHKDFYLTKAEAEQCSFLNIEVKAPIK